MCNADSCTYSQKKICDDDDGGGGGGGNILVIFARVKSIFFSYTLNKNVLCSSTFQKQTRIGSECITVFMKAKES